MAPTADKKTGTGGPFVIEAPVPDRKKVPQMRVIDWDRPDFGGHITISASGSHLDAEPADGEA